MNKASAPEMRKALLVVEDFKKAGILFIPMPIVDTEDKNYLFKEFERRIDIIEGMHTVVKDKEHQKKLGSKIMKRLIKFIFLVCFLSLCTSAQAQYYLQWADEFQYTGYPNPERWSYEIGNLRNQEAQYYTDRLENVRVDGEYLIIEAHKESYEGYAYTSGSIHTAGKYYIKSGKVEIRAKMEDDDEGLWPAGWTSGKNYPQLGWPACGEIDIFEHVGREPGVIHANVHYGLTNHYAAPGLTTGIDVTQFHTYVIEWNSEAITWSVDGVQYHSFQVSDAQEGDYNPFMNDHILRLNLAIGGTFGGDIDDSKFPHQYVIDYVRVYSFVDDTVFNALGVVRNFLIINND